MKRTRLRLRDCVVGLAFEPQDRSDLKKGPRGIVLPTQRFRQFVVLALDLKDFDCLV